MDIKAVSKLQDGGRGRTQILRKAKEQRKEARKNRNKPSGRILSKIGDISIQDTIEENVGT